MVLIVGIIVATLPVYIYSYVVWRAVEHIEKES